MGGGFIARIADGVWGPATVFVILFSGIYFSCGTGFFQLRRLRLWLGETILAAAKDTSKPLDGKALSPFQSLTVALAGTMGTGNIVGVAAAVTVGGAGAVFWMWTAAFFGMMTAYAENVLGIVYRRRSPSGEWLGGPMAYMEHGLGAKKAAVLFAFFCMISSFGMGNMVQINSVAGSLSDAFGVPYLLTGLLCAAVTGAVLLGGLKRAASFTEKLMPLLSGVYILACLTVIFAFLPRVPGAFKAIFIGAFSPRAAAGGVFGTVMTGIRRGVSSNEAGLGSSVMVHSCAEVECPAQQGMWGIFEVFVDTVVVCTLTALVILVSGVSGSESGAVLSARAFSSVFGSLGSPFVAVCVALFAFSTLVGWSCYGEKCFVYLFGESRVFVYRAAFVGFTVLGSVLRVDAVWDISDILNALMVFINVPAVFLLSPKVFSETAAFVRAKKIRRAR